MFYLLEPNTPVKCSVQAGEQWEEGKALSRCQMRDMEQNWALTCFFLLFTSLSSVPGNLGQHYLPTLWGHAGSEGMA